MLAFARDAGIEVVFNEEYNQQATDLTGLVQQAKATNPDAFIALGLPDDSALMAKTVQRVNFKPKFYCQCGSQVTTLPNWRDLGPAGVNVFSTVTALENLLVPMLHSKEHRQETASRALGLLDFVGARRAP